MSDDENNQPQETPKESTSQKLNNESKQQEGPKDTKVIELNESFAGKSQPGDQGVFLKPIGSHATNPFTPQDTIQPSSPTPSQPEDSPSTSMPPAQADTSTSSTE